jgi:hypothetical protein
MLDIIIYSHQGIETTVHVVVIDDTAEWWRNTGNVKRHTTLGVGWKPGKLAEHYIMQGGVSIYGTASLRPPTP